MQTRAPSSTANVFRPGTHQRGSTARKYSDKQHLPCPSAFPPFRLVPSLFSFLPLYANPSSLLRERKRWKIHDQRDRASRRIRPTTRCSIALSPTIISSIASLYASTRTAYLRSGQRDTNYRQIRIGVRLERTLREGNVAARAGCAA